MHQYRMAASGPISARSVMVRRGSIPTQPYAIHQSLPHFPWQTRNLRPAFPGSMAMQERDHLEGFFDIVKSAVKGVAKVVKGAVGDSTVTLPGGVDVKVRDLPTVARGSSIRFGQTQDPVAKAVDAVPGGWGTIGVGTMVLLGVGAMLLMRGRGR
jgi:hypothetical protein